MTRHEIIQTGRKGVERSVAVERPRRRKIASPYTRKLVHEIGLAAVADELGVAALLPMGGVMTAERGRVLDGRCAKVPVAAAQKCQQAAPIVIPAPATLAADIGRHIHPARGVFGSPLWLGRTL